MKATKKKATGDCFERAFKLMLEYSHVPDLLLVHGIVWHKETGYHIHGWVEFNGMCFDYIGHGDSRALYAVEQKRYYELGKIKTGKVIKYTPQEAKRLAFKTGSYYFSNLPCAV